MQMQQRISECVPCNAMSLNASQSQSFSDSSSENERPYDEQNDRYHESQPEFSCMKCKKSYYIRKSYVNHMRSHDLNYVCGQQNCGKKFNTESSFGRHKRVHTGEQPYQCDYSACDKRFSQKSNLNRHKKIHKNDKKFICEKCCKKFTTTTNLKQHEQVHIENKEQRKKFNCDVEGCDKQYLYMCNLKKHARDHTDPLSQIIAEDVPQNHSFSVTVFSCKVKLVLESPSLRQYAEVVISYREQSGTIPYSYEELNESNLQTSLNNMLMKTKDVISSCIEVHEGLYPYLNRIIDLVVHNCGLTGCKTISIKVADYDTFVDGVGFMMKQYKPQNHIKEESS